MNTFKVFIAASALVCVSPLLAQADTASTSSCKPIQQVVRTDFPQQSQEKGEHGAVGLNVRIGLDGRAADVRVAQSSGYRTLDQAAATSVRNNWRFDISHCTAAELTGYRSVEVQFKRAPLYTLSRSINTRRAASEEKLRADNRCDSVRDATGNAVFACIKADAKDDVAKLAQRAAAQ